MSNTDLAGAKLAAALAEHVYRRSEDDIPITLHDLDATGISVGPIDASQFKTDTGPDGALFYYTDRGFVGEVVEKADTIYVVFRGSDSAEGFGTNFQKAFGANFDQTVRDPARLTDIGDFINNMALAAGLSVGRTQLDDALALTRAAEANAGDKRVVIVGNYGDGALN